jgi:hypothetical protein
VNIHGVNKKVRLTVMNRNCDAIVIDETGRERESTLNLFTVLILELSKKATKFKKGGVVAEWDPYSNPIISRSFATYSVPGYRRGCHYG